MTRTVNINGKDVVMRASALIPRLYRYQFSRDLIADLQHLENAYKKAKDDPDEQLSVLDLTIFENIAYLMIKHGGNDVPPTPEEWLDSIDGIFDIYQVFPVVLELWGANMAQTSKSVKK